MKLAQTADHVAASLYVKPINPWVSQSELIRDACDIATGGELSPSMLDRLCDMVQRRLKEFSAYARRRGP